jgi:hypothetical protein
MDDFEITLLNENFRPIYNLDSFKSFLWVDRYSRTGDFEIQIAPVDEVLLYLDETEYIKLKSSTRLMLLEDIGIDTDLDEGDTLTLKGRSLESILDRRIIYNPIVLFGDLQTEIHNLLNSNIISPDPTVRQISNFNFVSSTDTAITDLSIDTQFDINDLYTILSEICLQKEIGFQITLNEKTHNFDFLLYCGKNRASDQYENGPVKFSKNMENLISSRYIRTKKFKKTHVRVYGETGVGNLPSVWVDVIAPGGSLSGLLRREHFHKASITRNSSLGELTEMEYLSQLNNKGHEILSQNTEIESFDADVDTKAYLYGVAFGLGDIVEIEDAYGHNKKVRVSEMIYSQDKEGKKSYPMFDGI